MNDVKLLSPSDVAQILGIQTQTLAVWRTRKSYPLRYIKVGRNIRYRQDDVEQFLAERTVQPVTAD